MPKSRPYLFEIFPELERRLPWTPLGEMPTPARRLPALSRLAGAPNLYLKEDNLTSDIYGGNKVRKLEFALAEARASDAGLVITMGAVGSNHVLATTIHGSRLGLKTAGVFMPQPVQEYLRANILCNSMAGCRIEYVRNAPELVVRTASLWWEHYRRTGRRAYLLPPGGSNLAGTLGYVEAGVEIAAQARAGVMPEPDYIFAPVGSAGTLAGLVAGCLLAGLKSRPVGVRVFDRQTANETVTAFMANRVLRRLRELSPRVPRLAVRSKDVLMLHDYFGRGYARYTKKGARAVELARDLEGVSLEGTYTGKALAGFLEFMGERPGATGLFINTYNSAPLSGLLDACPGPEILPAELQRYFREEPLPPED